MNASVKEKSIREKSAKEKSVKEKSVKEKTDTRDLILAQATELFSQFGYGGTSVRDIASACDVNIAAVNYHFKSKHNLYWASVGRSHQWLSQTLEALAKKCDTVEDLVVEVYSHIMKDPSYVRSALKMMLVKGVPDPEGDFVECLKGEAGPPGAEFVAQVLGRQVPHEVNKVALAWGVKNIFGNIMHWSMISVSSKFELMQKNNPEFMSQDSINQSLRMHATAIREYMVKNHETISKTFVHDLC